MIRFVFLIPLILCLIWYAYLRHNNWSIEQGKQGFMAILGVSLALAGFFALMIYLTHR